MYALFITFVWNSYCADSIGSHPSASRVNTHKIHSAPASSDKIIKILNVLLTWHTSDVLVINVSI